MSIEVRRGDVVVLASAGDFTGKPRPALVVQNDLFNPSHGSVTVCLITTTLCEAPLFRLTLLPSESNGLRKVSQVMVDKVTTVRADAIATRVGTVQGSVVRAVDEALRLWLGV